MSHAEHMPVSTIFLLLLFLPDSQYVLGCGRTWPSVSLVIGPHKHWVWTSPHVQSVHGTRFNTVISSHSSPCCRRDEESIGVLDALVQKLGTLRPPGLRIAVGAGVSGGSSRDCWPPLGPLGPAPSAPSAHHCQLRRATLPAGGAQEPVAHSARLLRAQGEPAALTLPIAASTGSCLSSWLCVHPAREELRSCSRSSMPCCHATASTTWISARWRRMRRASWCARQPGPPHPPPRDSDPS